MSAFPCMKCGNSRASLEVVCPNCHWQPGPTRTPMTYKKRPWQFGIQTMLMVVLGVSILSAIIRPSLIPPEEPVHALPQYVGKSEKAVLAKLGSPARTDRFSIPGFPLGIRSRLNGLCPPNNVPIKEFMWVDGDYNITLWLRQTTEGWVVLDALKWHQDVIFD